MKHGEIKKIVTYIFAANPASGQTTMNDNYQQVAGVLWPCVQVDAQTGFSTNAGTKEKPRTLNR